MTAPLLTPDFGDAERFIALIADGSPTTFQWFDDRKEGRVGAAHETAAFDAIKTKLVGLNRAGAGIFLMINEGDGGRSNSAVTRVRAVFADLDGAPLEPVLAAGLEPHCVVNTSPGKWHVYWLVGDCPVEQFRAVQVAISLRFGGDKGVKDPCRVMRLPGFFHRKKDPIPTSVAALNEFQPYSLSQVVSRLGLNLTAAAADLSDSSAPLEPFDQRPPGSVKAGARHETLLRYAALDAMQGLSKARITINILGINQYLCSPPKSNDEVLEIVDYAFRTNAFSTPTSGPEVTIDVTALLNQNANRVIKEALRSNKPGLREKALPKPLVTDAPGLVGEIAAWINSTTRRHQPEFALAAALSYVGILKAHRVKTASGERTNHMALGLGKSGSGKSEAGNRVCQLSERAGTEFMMMGVPASDSGLRSELSARRGRGFIFWDEMGLALEKMLSKNAPGFYGSVKDLLVQLYTASDGTLRKKGVVSKENQSNYVDIVQPCLGFFGTAQPDIFYNALSGASAADGFYPRLLVFETENHYPPAREIDSTEPPEELINKCWEIETRWPTNVSESNGNLQQLRIEPRVVPFSPRAKELMRATAEDIQKRLERASKSVTSGVWARTMSHISKIALTVTEGPEVSNEAVTWATDLMMSMSQRMSDTFEAKVSDSPIERDRKKVLELIVEAGAEGIKASVLTDLTRFLRDKMHRSNILADLEESERIVCMTLPSSTNKAKVWYSVSALKSNGVIESS